MGENQEINKDPRRFGYKGERCKSAGCQMCGNENKKQNIKTNFVNSKFSNKV